MSGYTKGPWTLDGHTGYDEIEGARIRDNRHYILAVVIGDCPDEFDYVANAHLIAAAPDMYEALKAVKDYLNSDHEVDVDRVADMIDAAISKAEGK